MRTKPNGRSADLRIGRRSRRVDPEIGAPAETANVAGTEKLCFKPSPIHGLGGFARSDIAAGARIVEYVGERITKRESLRRCEQSNPFLFELDAVHDLDGSVDWNPARFLNHSCAPNSEARCEDGRIWIVALRGIAAGEEVTFNYGYDLEDYRDHPCRCGSPACAGFMVAEELGEYVRGRQGIAR